MAKYFRQGTVIANAERKSAGVVTIVDTDGYYIINQFGMVYIAHNVAHFWHDVGTRSLELFNHVWRASKRFPYYICNDQKSIYYRDRENGYWRFMEMPKHEKEVIPLEG